MPSATTKMSSRGQVVIPEKIRNKLHLKPGDQFIVMGEGDVVILKNISSPDISEFDHLISEVREAAATYRVQANDISQAIDEVRRNK